MPCRQLSGAYIEWRKVAQDFGAVGMTSSLAGGALGPAALCPACAVVQADSEDVSSTGARNSCMRLAGQLLLTEHPATGRGCGQMSAQVRGTVLHAWPVLCSCLNTGKWYGLWAWPTSGLLCVVSFCRSKPPEQPHSAAMRSRGP